MLPISWAPTDGKLGIVKERTGRPQPLHLSSAEDFRGPGGIKMEIACKYNGRA